MNLRELIHSHPAVKGSVPDPLIQCIELCASCAQSCMACADACLAEPTVDELRQCVRLNLDCAAICCATGTVASRQSGSNETVLLQLLKVCVTACWLCAEECEKHGSAHEHCRLCAEECRRCEEACERALRELDAADRKKQAN